MFEKNENDPEYLAAAQQARQVHEYLKEEIEEGALYLNVPWTFMNPGLSSPLTVDVWWELPASVDDDGVVNLLRIDLAQLIRRGFSEDVAYAVDEGPAMSTALRELAARIDEIVAVAKRRQAEPAGILEKSADNPSTH